jgi:hypothetical protein
MCERLDYRQSFIIRQPTVTKLAADFEKPKARLLEAGLVSVGGDFRLFVLTVLTPASKRLIDRILFDFRFLSTGQNYYSLAVSILNRWAVNPARPCNYHESGRRGLA